MRGRYLNRHPSRIATIVVSRAHIVIVGMNLHMYVFVIIAYQSELHDRKRGFACANMLAVGRWHVARHMAKQRCWSSVVCGTCVENDLLWAIDFFSTNLEALEVNHPII